MADRLAEHLRARGQTARTVTTKLRYPDFAIRTRSTSLAAGTDDGARIGELACRLLDRALRDRPGPLRLVGVGLYGTPVHRRVETATAPLRVVAAPPVQKTVDATMKPGALAVDDYGVPAQATSVERKVYSADGRLLSDQTWYSSYRAEPKLIRFDPKPKAAAITPGSLKLPQ